MRTGPDVRVRRGKGPAWVLAALGGLLVLAALTLTTGHSGGDAHAHDAPSPAARSRHGSSSTGDRSPVTAAHARVAVGRPVRLTIPSLGASAPVTAVRLRSSVLVPPSDPQVLGWWSGGALPGARHGTTVIAGHTVHTGGGTFDHLDRLARGDRLSLETGTGVLKYRVTAVTDRSKAWLAAHAQTVFSQTVPGRLALVTCSHWTGTAYLSNTVVLAAPTTR